MLRWKTISVAYLLLALVACVISLVVRDANPFLYTASWLLLEEPLRSASSLVLGSAFAIVVVVATRVAVVRWEWARRLHQDLRPVTRYVSSGGLILAAAFSGLAEELWFRGLLMSSVGVLVQSVLFGLVHQMRGPSRWVWVAWAALVGLSLGVLVALTGTLVGAIAAHALINAHNLIFLRDYDPAPKPNRLGGLLAPSDV